MASVLGGRIGLKMQEEKQLICDSDIQGGMKTSDLRDILYEDNPFSEALHTPSGMQ